MKYLSIIAQLTCLYVVGYLSYIVFVTTNFDLDLDSFHAVLFIMWCLGAASAPES